MPQSCPTATSDRTTPQDRHRGCGPLHSLRSAGPLREEDQPLAALGAELLGVWVGWQPRFVKEVGAPSPQPGPSSGSKAWPWTSFPAPLAGLTHILGVKGGVDILEEPLSQKVLPGNSVWELQMWVIHGGTGKLPYGWSKSKKMVKVISICRPGVAKTIGCCWWQGQMPPDFQ